MHSSKDINRMGEKLFSDPETAEYKVWLETMLETFGTRSRPAIDGVWTRLLTARQAAEAEQARIAGLREAREFRLANAQAEKEARREQALRAREEALRAKEERGPNRVAMFFTTNLFRLVGVALIVGTWTVIPEPARHKALLLGHQTWVYVFLGLALMAVSFVVTCFTAIPTIIVLRAGIAYAVDLYYMRAMRTLRPAYVYMINILVLSAVLKGYYYCIGSYFPWAEGLFWIVFVYLMFKGFWKCGKTPENWMDFIDTQQRHLTPWFRSYLAERAEADGVSYDYTEPAGRS